MRSSIQQDEGSRGAAAAVQALHLYGRDGERAALSALLDGARAFRSGILVVRGAPGIGKSALIADLVAHAEGVQVLQASGVEHESGLPFAGLHQLLRPVFDAIEEIPEPQADALRSALGFREPEGADPFLVGVGLLSLLAWVAEQRPLLCAVEDLQWMDTPSADAITFAARRLDAEAIAIVLALRDGERSSVFTRGLPELPLGGLSEEAAGRLIVDRVAVDLAPSARDALIASAEGNPLVLLELPLAMTDAQRSGREPLSDPLPLTARLEEAFSARAASLTPDSRLLLLIAASDNTDELAVVLAAAEALGVAPRALEPCEAAGLIRLADGQIRFRHPLIRSAVYRGATFSRRREVHLALAGVLGAERYADCRAWQLAAAATGPDEEVAEALVQSAGRARARNGYATAASALARAAALTVDDQTRAARRYAAADAALQAGESDVAAGLLADAHAVARTQPLVADIERLRGLIEVENGSPVVACEILLGAASEIMDSDPARAGNLLLEAASAARYGAARPVGSEIGRRAETLSAQLGPNFEVTVTAGLGRLWDEDDQGRVLLEQAMAQAEASDSSQRHLWAAVCAFHIGDETAARMYAGREADLARAQGAVRHLVTALTRLAFAEIQEGRFASARANASEGLELARHTGLENIECYHRAVLAWAAALLGYEQEARTQAAASLELAKGGERAWQAAVASIALGELELGLGRPIDALAHLRPLAPPNRLAHPYLSVRAAPSLVEAAVRTGHHDLAQAALHQLQSWVRVTGSLSGHALLARCRALVSGEQESQQMFDEALEAHRGIHRPFDEARTELLYGEALRRAGRRGEARAHLRAARDRFDLLGASLFGDRARAELRALGEKPRAPSSVDPEPVAALTPQELQVARFVATGATNKQIAAQLFLSPRTIDAHLRSVFRKLDLTSRGQLAGLRLGEDRTLTAAEG